ncbi:MAG: 16S rRNA (uracil(1498)-N(3))-methyltransferase [Candidatus Omnitrophica bacterium]|jgi:16S rRNA (uracil1498-N3)-methyltransferase|nr:16S rRNA (uracil(1498)-N(3))-methyltransferase [Candidatus Omnitrophota bacterium]
MHKFFVPEKSILKGKIIITDEKQLHHMYGVLHLKVNEPLKAFDEKGSVYSCTLESLSAEKAVLAIREKCFPEAKKKPAVTIACAIPKKSKFDDIIDKLTQLGVEKIIPLKTERVVVKLNKEKEAARMIRWQKITLAAAEQSQRNDLVILEDVQSLKEVLQRVGNYDLKIIPTLEGNRRSLKEIFLQTQAKKILALVGPEGDFTPIEVELARKAGCIPVSLGDLVLRVETAAVAVASFLMLNEDH